jgi:D-psicose/D-tagatose/L-ribulose 3-epimerase
LKIGRLVEDFALLPRVADAGYDYAEAVPWLLGPDRADKRLEHEALRVLADSPIPVRSLCGFLPNPQSNGLYVVGPAVDRGRLRSYVKRVFRRMHAAGIMTMVYGCGPSRWVPDGWPRSRAGAQLEDFLVMCADLAESKSVRIALEPYNRTDANLINTLDEANDVLRRLNRAELGLTADFFHMRLNNEPIDHLSAVGDLIAHAHIAEPGRGQPTSTSRDHAVFLQALERAGYHGHVTQTGSLDAYRNDAEAVASLRSALSD